MTLPSSSHTCKIGSYVLRRPVGRRKNSPTVLCLETEFVGRLPWWNAAHKRTRSGVPSLLPVTLGQQGNTVRTFLAGVLQLIQGLLARGPEFGLQLCIKLNMVAHASDCREVDTGGSWSSRSFSSTSWGLKLVWAMQDPISKQKEP